MHVNRKSIFKIVAVLAVVILIFPWKTTVAPAVRVRVFDELGNPASGVTVRQEWEYFSVGSEMRKEYARTDEQGYVSFPRRSVHIMLLLKILSAGLELLSAGHYGMGAHAMIWAHGSDAHVWSFVYCGVSDPAPKEMRMKHWVTTSVP